MVKNIHGGSKHKSFARKNAPKKGGFSSVRLAQEEGECYAQVEKILGGANCVVNCIDNKSRLCHIRGKFRGRGKRDNTIAAGSWILVGLRDFESSSERKDGKLENCDLLEVYRDTDKERLTNATSSKTLDWSGFLKKDKELTHIEGCDDVDFKFTTEEDEEELNLVKESLDMRSGTIENKIITMVSHKETEEDDEEEEEPLYPSSVMEWGKKHGDDDDDIDIDDI